VEKLAEVCKAGDGLLLATSYRQVDVTDTASVEEATQWWEDLTGRGGEGMVGSEAAGFYCAGTARLDAARGQMSRPRIPANHLRA
jgi:PNKP (polynucleotide 5'-kinase/3'-phosphatase) family adenylyltransferase-like protein